MKLLFFFLPVFIFNGFSRPLSTPISSKQTSDSTVIHHVLDGFASEWPAARFETDKESAVQYAVDNDAENLFIVMKVPGFRTQMKMMRQGMELYVDLKGKKKKTRGIDFPVKKEGDNSGNFFTRDRNSSGQGNQQGFDVKAARNAMAVNLYRMKLFGFFEGEPFDQGLMMPNTSNIAYNWDSLDAMIIEYLIPLKMLDEKLADLDHKEISVGWKINGVDISLSTSSGAPSSGSTIPGGARGGRISGRNAGGAGQGQNSNSSITEDESFWTKYTFSFPSR